MRRQGRLAIGPQVCNLPHKQDSVLYTRRVMIFKTTFLAMLVAASLCVQGSFFGDWFQRSDQAKADQRHCITPVATVTPRLEQEFRTDFLVDQMPTRDSLVSFGGSKGLRL